jgi:hypothetical protein
VSWAQRQAAVYPPEEGVTARMMRMPVQAPDRAPRSRRCERHAPLPGCAACSKTGPCARHASFDLLASLGAAPPDLSPDELVHYWTEVRRG